VAEVQVFGGRSHSLPAGWTDETIVSVVGSVDLDAGQPADGATLTVVAGVGSVNIRVPVGARVTMEGFTLLGGRKSVHASPGDGPRPRITIRAYSLVGSVQVFERHGA
jgi:hypothetical protein